jgi:hypothetical protein
MFDNVILTNAFTSMYRDGVERQASAGGELLYDTEKGRYQMLVQGRNKTNALLRS